MKLTFMCKDYSVTVSADDLVKLEHTYSLPHDCRLYISSNAYEAESFSETSMFRINKLDDLNVIYLKDFRTMTVVK